MLKSTQHNLLGLSPYYWTYIPMLNYNILHSLELLNGVNCYVFTNPNTKNKDTDNSQIIIPITRCELVGIIVNITNRSNGAIMYLLDDGTGFIDCLTWSKDDPNDPYTLPSFSDYTNVLHLGDLVCIRGKIKCLEKYHSNDSNNDNQMVREIHISTIEKMTQSSDWDCESVHWMKCLQFQKRIYDSQKINDEQTNTQILHMVNGTNVLQCLGTNIKSFLQNYTNDLWYESNYTIQNVQNVQNSQDVHMHKPTYSRINTNESICHCHFPHKEVLLYCHCIATKIDLDPNFTFRDALLSHLLLLEQNIISTNCNYHSNSSHTSTHPFYKQSSLLQLQPLFFQYKTILQNSSLFQIAMNLLTSSNIPNQTKQQPSISISTKTTKHTSTGTNQMQISALRRSLYMNTFRALRKDGIIYLLDVHKDDYVFLTRHTVLLPLLKTFMNIYKSKNEQQEDPIISPKKSMTLVKHLLSEYEFMNNIPIAKIQFLLNEINATKSS